MAIDLTARPTANDHFRAPGFVFSVWLLLSAVLICFWYLGYSAYGDSDDILKTELLRNILATGALRERTIPSIMQPEVFTTHWTLIAEAPYLFITWLLRPVLGQEPALQFSIFLVPLLLLLATLFLIERMGRALGFQGAMVVLVAGFTISFSEFQPGRIDYHNMQMLLLVGIALCTMSSGVKAALACGILVALSFSISAELAFFVGLAMAVYVFRFIGGKPDAANELAAFGIGLFVAAVVLWAIINPSPAWAAQGCDRYGTPHLLALCGAGATFVIAANLFGKLHWSLRTIAVGLGAAVTSIAIAKLFPDCLRGPYSILNGYAYENLIGPMMQEKSAFARPTGSAFVWALGIVGQASSAVVIVVALLLAPKRDRAWAVSALFAVLGIVLSIAYIRYARFGTFFFWPGLLLAFVLVKQALPRAGSLIPTNAIIPTPKFRYLVAPLIALLALLLVFSGKPISREFRGYEVASFCAGEPVKARDWPAGSRIMAPSILDMRLLGQPGAVVTSAPFHTGGSGLEKTFRFFDPGTRDPQYWLGASQANLVAVCAADAQYLKSLEDKFPLATSLMKGNAPEWLSACPHETGDVLRVYRRTGAPLSVCPVLAQQMTAS